jgi:hypothetical protein
MSHDKPSVWDDPDIKAALAEGREPGDIAVLNCPDCGRIGYYNEGSHFYCRHCDKGFRVLVQEEMHELDDPDCNRSAVIVLEETLTLQDVIDAECEDYP